MAVCAFPRELVGVDLAQARPFENNADWVDALDATSGCKADGKLEPLDVASAEAPPGPRSVAGLKATSQPLD